MSKILKMTCAVLSAVTVSSLFAGCADKQANITTTVPPQDTTVQSTTEGKLLPDLPEDADFGGHEFVFLITGNTENNWKKNDFFAESENGEAINDARYMRNTYVEDKYNIKITTVENYGGDAGTGPGFQAIKKSVLAGDYSYDAGMIKGYDTCTLASGGFLTDLNDLPYLDLSQPWWDQKANKDLTIKGKMFYTTGDISTADNDATYAILFNKKLVQEYSLPNPYELVSNGTWTMNKFAEMAKSVSKDLNGDGKYDKNDLYGAIVWDDTMMGLVNAAGEKCCTIDDEGQIQLTFYNDRVQKMFEEYTSVLFDKTVTYAYQRVSYDLTDPIAMFSGNQSLFFLQMLDMVSNFRNMETDFGILPWPKLEESQAEYGHTIGSWHSVFMCVPAVMENPERTGIILEALAAESMYTVTPAYYEKTLIGKFVRDEDSRAMLDIILSTRVYDLGWYYQIGGYNEEIMHLFRNYKSDFLSMYEKCLSKAEKNIQKINDAFSESMG
ncbi:MAG: extracellular solute-binding protein [Eubacteriales bacterium]